MRKLSNRSMAILGAVALLFAVGLLFPVPMPEISLPAERIGSIFGFPLTNTILAAWLSMIVLLALSWAGTRRMQEVPSGLQNFIEMIVEMLLGLVENVAGKENGRRFFPLVATIFLFILVSNWLGLAPGFGTIGIVEEKKEHSRTFEIFEVGGLEIAYLPLRQSAQAEGQSDKLGKEGSGQLEMAKAEDSHQIHGVLVPLLRSANTDLNTTLALALVAMFFIEYWGFSMLGIKGYGGKFINLKGGIVGLFVGIMELVSEFARIISFTFRLFGNIFAGEVLLGVVVFLIPWVAVLPFFGLELFVGFIQAFIFAMLTLAFAAIAVAGHGEEEHEKAGHH